MTHFLPRLDIEQVQESTLFFLAEDPSTDEALLDQMAKYFLTTESLIEKIIRHPRVAQTTLNYIRLFGTSAQGAETASFTGMPSVSEAEIQQRRVRSIEQLRVPEKLRLALNGNREARFLLLRDPNRQVALMVIKSPRLTDDDVEAIAKSRYVSEEILRVVAKNPTWTQRYTVRVALAGNPKTPLATALGFLKGLRDKDIQQLAKDKGVSGAVRTTAARMIQARKG